MRIDLHLHSFVSKQNGDVGIKWIDYKQALRKLIDFNIKIASFTDHNTFNANFYIEARDFAKTGKLLLLPGIELNVIRKNGFIGHMLIIFSNKLSDENLFKIEQKCRSILKSGISINNVNNLFSEFKTIRIIHVGKTDYFELDDIIDLDYDAIEVTNFNHQNYKKFIKANIPTSIVAFSDTHKWQKYPEQNLLYTDISDLAENEFDELKDRLRNNKNYVKNY